MVANKRERARLDPTAWDRVRTAVRGGHSTRMLAIRRFLAAGLILLAGVLAFLPQRGMASSGVPVLIATRDLAPGHVLARGDLERRQLPAGLAPAGVLRDPAAAEGRTLAGAARKGEPLTDVRLAGEALTRLTTDGTHAAVPLRLADPGVADLLHPGRKVDVVTNAAQSGGASVLAERAPVLAIRPAEGRHEQGRLIVVGLPEQKATEVASASLSQSVTVTLR